MGLRRFKTAQPYLYAVSQRLFFRVEKFLEQRSGSLSHISE